MFGGAEFTAKRLHLKQCCLAVLGHLLDGPAVIDGFPNRGTGTGELYSAIPMATRGVVIRNRHPEDAVFG